jgi:membrane carboxypeptidase/penicillin-binding protein
MKYKGFILLLSVVAVGTVYYMYKKKKSDLPTFDEATNTIIKNGNIYSANGKLIKCVNPPCYDDLTKQ